MRPSIILVVLYSESAHTSYLKILKVRRNEECKPGVEGAGLKALKETVIKKFKNQEYRERDYTYSGYVEIRVKSSDTRPEFLKSDVNLLRNKKLLRDDHH
jgi:hypothetical protein